MHEDLLNASVAGPKKARFVAKGEERFAFLYAVISAIAIGCAMTFSWVVGLAWWQTVLLLIGALIGAWATVFSFLEVRRLNQAKKTAEEALEEAEDPYAARNVAVAAPTGDPYPHHEDFAESAGFDQGQLTSRVSDSTPLVDRFRRPRRGEKQHEKQEAAH
jgi:hypothetical protein